MSDCSLFLKKVASCVSQNYDKPSVVFLMDLTCGQHNHSPKELYDIWRHVPKPYGNDVIDDLIEEKKETEKERESIKKHFEVCKLALEMYDGLKKNYLMYQDYLVEKSGVDLALTLLNDDVVDKKDTQTQKLIHKLKCEQTIVPFAAPVPMKKTVKKALQDAKFAMNRKICPRLYDCLCVIPDGFIANDDYCPFWHCQTSVDKKRKEIAIKKQQQIEFDKDTLFYQGANGFRLRHLLSTTLLPNELSSIILYYCLKHVRYEIPLLFIGMDESQYEDGHCQCCDSGGDYYPLSCDPKNIPSEFCNRCLDPSLRKPNYKKTNINSAKMDIYNCPSCGSHWISRPSTYEDTNTIKRCYCSDKTKVGCLLHGFYVVPSASTKGYAMMCLDCLLEKYGFYEKCESAQYEKEKDYLQLQCTSVFYS